MIGIAFDSSDQSGRKISIKAGDFLKGVGKALVHASAGNYTTAAAEIPSIAAAVGLKASPQERVGTLFIRSLERALSIVVADAVRDRDDIKGDIEKISIIGLSDISLELNHDFFQNPKTTDLLAKLRPTISNWLDALSVSVQEIDSVFIRFPSYFTRALHDEWRSNPGYYGELIKGIDSPFVGAAIMEQEWERYRSYLSTLGDERVFDESFGLRQIYVPPRCYYFERQKDLTIARNFSEIRRRSDEPVRVLKWAHDEIEEWLAKEDRDFPLRTIAGGPGSGKSSFAKMLAAKLAISRRRVLFVPLHQVDLETGVSKALPDYFKQAGHFAEDPLAMDDATPLILILDGLDEIQMQGKAAQESANDFVADLIRYIDRKNAICCKLLCLITGRDLAVQSVEGALKAERQIVHIAPYHIPEYEKNFYADPHAIFVVDQRDEWWTTYGRLTGQFYDGMPEKFRAGELDEVTAQPLLNYLVALASRRGLVIDETTNINEIYGDLLNAVYARGWARHTHISVKGVTRDAFIRLLEEVALSVWHGAGRTTTLAEVEAHCAQSRVGALLPAFQSGVSSGVSSLLLAFYFRQKGRRDNGEKTFEFTHKTFAEYLISLRVIRLVELIANQVEANRLDPDQGFDASDALYRWVSICGQAGLDSYVIDFIVREVSIRGQRAALSWQHSLSYMLEICLKSGWPIHKVAKLSFNEQISYVRNAEETLIACHHACTMTTKYLSEIRWPTPTSAGDMIRRLQGQRSGPLNRSFMNCLTFINFDEQRLDIIDLYDANLSGSSFRQCQMNYAFVLLANFSHTNLSGAEISGSNISDTRSLKDVRISINQLTKHRNRLQHEEVRDESDNSTRSVRFTLYFKRIISAIRRRGGVIVDDDNQIIDGETEQALLERKRGASRLPSKRSSARNPPTASKT